jgi:hypothetical protein
MTASQERALACLLEAKTVSEAASLSGVSVRTLHRWLQLLEFKAAYAEARKALVDGAIVRLQGASSKSADCLVGLLDSDKPGIALAAAKEILRIAVESLSLIELEARLSSIELTLQSLSTAQWEIHGIR